MTKLQLTRIKKRVDTMYADLQSMFAQLERAHGDSIHDGWVYCDCEMADLIKRVRAARYELRP